MANTTGQKHGGRKKGRPNRLTRELRTILKDVLYQEMEQLEERLNDLDPKDRMQIILKLMPYIFPKVMDVQLTKDKPLAFGFFLDTIFNCLIPNDRMFLHLLFPFQACSVYPY